MCWRRSSRFRKSRSKLRTRSTDNLQLERILRQYPVSEQVANTCPANREPSGGEGAQNLQGDTTQRAFTRTGKVPGEQASRRCSEGQDHQDESAVKENPTIQEKSQPREQAKKKEFTRFEFPEEQFRGISSARGGTEVGSNSPDRPEKTWRLIKCSTGQCRRCGFRTCCTKTSSSIGES